MALVLKDRVKETTSTTGTGTLTLAGAATGFQSFSVVGNGNTTYYTITDGTDWEVGIGTYTASGTTLSRDTVLSSSNSGSAVNLGAGSKDVFVTAPASQVTAMRVWVNFDGTGTVAIHDSLNVSSVTDNGTGDYTVNFSITMPDANFGIMATAGRGAAGGEGIIGPGGANPTTTSVRVQGSNYQNTASDREYTFVGIITSS